MSDLIFKSALLAIAATQVEATIPGRDLADCREFAVLFDNTDSCTGGKNHITNFSSGYEGDEVTCIGNMRCPGTEAEALYTNDNPCTFNRNCVSHALKTTKVLPPFACSTTACTNIASTRQSTLRKLPIMIGPSSSTLT